MNLYFRIAAPIALAVLTGCAAYRPEPSQTPQLPPGPIIAAAEARKLVVAERARYWKDPYSIRDARSGQPARCEHELLKERQGFVKVAGSCMCIEANAKNSMGGYVGTKRTIAVFPDEGGIDWKDGGILGFPELCSALVPFPELNGK